MRHISCSDEWYTLSKTDITQLYINVLKMMSVNCKHQKAPVKIEGFGEHTLLTQKTNEQVMLNRLLNHFLFSFFVLLLM